MRELSIATRTSVAWHVIALTGELDFRTAPQLHAALQALELGPDRGLVIDLDGLTFCDSSGITAVLVARRLADAAGARLALAAVPGRVARTFELVGLDQVFTIHPTAAAATAGNLAQTEGHPAQTEQG